MNSVTALTVARSWFANNTDLPQIPLETVTPEVLAQYRIVVICPEKDFDPKPHEIVGWKREGLLPNTKLCFGSYKGVYYWKKEYEEFVERWVVHSRSEIERTWSEWFVFIPLSLSNSGIVGKGEGEYIFCGGRKWRNFELAIEAVTASGFKARFVSDVLPEVRPNNPNIEWTETLVPLEEYRKLLANSWLVLVPLRPRSESHGQSDVVRALVAGRPVVVSVGASCDDYVIDGVNGYLVKNDVKEWIAAIKKAWENRVALTAGAKASATEYGADLYNKRIYDMLQDIESHPQTS